MLDCNAVSTPILKSTKLDPDTEVQLLSAEDATLYRSIIGSLIYIMNATRPDIAFIVIRLSQYSKAPTTIHLDAAKRVLRYLRGTMNAQLRIRYDPDTRDLVGYFDSAHADCSGSRSTSAYVFLLHGSIIS